MSPTHNKKFELFDAYKEGNLSEEEMQAFSNKLLTDANFDQAYSDYLLSSEIIKEYERANIKNILDKIDYSNYNEKSDYGKLGWIISGLLVIGGLTTFILFQSKDTKPLPAKNSPVTISSINSGKNNVSDPSTGEAIKNEPTNISNQSNTTTKRESVQTTTEVNAHAASETSIATPVAIQTGELTKQNESVQTNQIKTPCEINCQIETSGTCPDKKAGTLLINQFKGGNGPYKVQLLYNGETMNYTTEADLRINHLSEGNYSVVIQDKTESCRKEFNNIKISTLGLGKCIQETYSVINTSLGETWTCPESNGTLEIKTLGGNLVFRKSMSDQENTEWNGTNTSGLPLSPGVYFFTIENKNSAIIHQGTITIVN